MSYSVFLFCGKYMGNMTISLNATGVSEDFSNDLVGNYILENFRYPIQAAFCLFCLPIDHLIPG